MTHRTSGGPHSFVILLSQRFVIRFVRCAALVRAQVYSMVCAHPSSI